jgi:hypothetical protein
VIRRTRSISLLCQPAVFNAGAGEERARAKTKQQPEWLCSRCALLNTLKQGEELLIRSRCPIFRLWLPWRSVSSWWARCWVRGFYISSGLSSTPFTFITLQAPVSLHSLVRRHSRSFGLRRFGAGSLLHRFGHFHHPGKVPHRAFRWRPAHPDIKNRYSFASGDISHS